LAKTDKLDTQVLTVFGQKVQPRLYESKSEAGKQLSAMLVRRRQLDEMLKAEQNRLRTISASLRGLVEQVIACLKEGKKALDAQIQQFVVEQQMWQEQIEILKSAPGVGKVTTATLIADLPELGKMDRKKIAALVATRRNPVVQAQYQQLLKRGKLKKIALIACRRTLRIEDYGKTAVTFMDTLSEQAIRIAPKPNVRQLAWKYAPSAQNKWEAQLVGYQHIPDDLMLDWRWVELTVPVKQIVSQPGMRVSCEICGEEIINQREVICEGTVMCKSCAGASYFRFVEH
jgi:hypothetical protein